MRKTAVLTGTSGWLRENERFQPCVFVVFLVRSAICTEFTGQAVSGSASEAEERVDFFTLWRLGGLSIWRLIRQSVDGYRAHQFDARSAQFAYYSMLALAPLLIVIIACVAQFPLEGALERQGVLESFLKAVAKGMPENVVELIKDQIRNIQAHSTWQLIVVGLALLGIAGSRVFLTMGAGLDAAYNVDVRRRFWKASSVSLALTVGVSLLLLAAMVLLVVGPLITRLVTDTVHIPWNRLLFYTGIRWGVACGFLLISTSVIYCVVPSVQLPWYPLSPGSLFATVGWVIVTQGFRAYVENLGRYNETYGALGGVVVLMIWFYLTGSLLLMGGQINSVIHRAAGGRKQ